MDSAEEKEIQKRLFAVQDRGYKAFIEKLVPTVPAEKIIGVRSPALRALSKEYSKDSGSAEFMKALPHFYYEENMLHAFLIEKIKDYGECIEALEAFLPYVDNWAVCDSMSPKALSKHLPELEGEIRRWIASGELYKVRFGMGMLMNHYLDAAFSPEYPKLVASVSSEEYYVRMMQAWYFATALAKQQESALPYLENGALETWTHNKTIQKAVESCRIGDEQKQHLRTLRKKKDKTV